jgi:hypothetical protein
MKEIRCIVPEQVYENLSEMLTKAGIVIMDNAATNWHEQVLRDRIEAEIASNLIGTKEQLGLILVSK